MKTFIFQILFAYSLAILTVSCHRYSTQCDYLDDDSIIVYYYRGIEFETSVNITCEETKRRFLSYENYQSEQTYDTLITETKIIDKSIYQQIKKLIAQIQKETKDPICDTRIFVRTDSVDFCIGPLWSNCLCGTSDFTFEDYLLLTYLIKWHSGFYNYFEEEDLETDKSIQLYGIPEDYHNIEIQKSPYRTVSKVILFSNS